MLECVNLKLYRYNVKQVKHTRDGVLCGMLDSTCVHSQTGRSLKECVNEHHGALKNGGIQSSALAEHVFKIRHAVDISQSEVLDHHQTTTNEPNGVAIGQQLLS